MRINKEALVLGLVSILFIGGMGYLIWHSSGIKPAEMVSDLSLLSNATSHMTGSPEAKVTVVEFGDYQCPACAQTHPAIKQVVDAYAANPDFNFVFRHFPLSQHANAVEAAAAAEASGAQGKYWEMHDMLYEHQNEWASLGDPTVVFVGYATTLGLDVARFTKEISDKKYADVIAADLSDGNRAGVNATPTIYINGTKVSGPIMVKSLSDAIDAALAQ
jgi:protein-disulfide isomerase